MGIRMRILAIADVHGSERAVATVNAQVERYSPDLVVVAGDITQFGPAGWAKVFLDSISVTTLALPGNCDPLGVMDTIEESRAVALHAKKTEVDGITFVGYGGSNTTPFGTPCEFSEMEIYDILEGLMVKNAVLVVHAPPKGHLDRTSTMTDLGSEAIARIVSEFSPRLVISAHIHESRGVETGGTTTFVNPGPASRGYAAVIGLNDGIEVELIEG